MNTPVTPKSGKRTGRRVNYIANNIVKAWAEVTDLPFNKGRLVEHMEQLDRWNTQWEQIGGNSQCKEKRNVK